MHSERSQDQTNARVSRRYSQWYTGDGAKTEFALPKDLVRPENLYVTVQGQTQRPKDATGAFDYDVRGFTPAYAGEKNMVKFTVAPAAGVNIGLHIHAD